MIGSDVMKEIEDLVSSNLIPGCSEFRNLLTVNECFNHVGLCGIVNSNTMYIWCHQREPKNGEKPHECFDVKCFNTLNEVLDYVKQKL